ncbi:MAG: hypothetical protein KAU16_02505 [Methanophagales archaeon]|nr:hypothetical protein [Methanophagales archaeon]
MNTAEKIVSVYLRLNGFFVLNQFTHLPEFGYSMESDMIAIRCPNSEERVNGNKLQIDDKFFESCKLNKNEAIGLIVEIKGGSSNPQFNQTTKTKKKIEYAKNFFGDFQDKVYLCDVSDSYNDPNKKDGTLIKIGIRYIAQEVKGIIKKRGELCNKQNSWYLNEGLLSDLIYLEKIGYTNKFL